MTQAGFVRSQKRRCPTEAATVSVTEILGVLFEFTFWHTEPQKPSLEVEEAWITDLASYVEGRVKISQSIRSNLAQNSSASCRQKLQGKPCWSKNVQKFSKIQTSQSPADQEVRVMKLRRLYSRKQMNWLAHSPGRSHWQQERSHTSLHIVMIENFYLRVDHVNSSQSWQKSHLNYVPNRNTGPKASVSIPVPGTFLTSRIAD